MEYYLVGAHMVDSVVHIVWSIQRAFNWSMVVKLVFLIVIASFYLRIIHIEVKDIRLRRTHLSHADHHLGEQGKNCAIN
jgi:hypothetical protein